MERTLWYGILAVDWTARIWNGRYGTVYWRWIGQHVYGTDVMVRYIGGGLDSTYMERTLWYGILAVDWTARIWNGRYGKVYWRWFGKHVYGTDVMVRYIDGGLESMYMERTLWYGILTVVWTARIWNGRYGTAY